MAGNVTVNPRSRATPVDDPVITEVRSVRTGRLLGAKRLIRLLNYGGAIRLRSVLKSAARQERPRLVCPTCGVMLFLASSMHKKFHFRHRSEDGTCPAVTHSGLTEADIRAMKYRGAQESHAHLRTKELVVLSLQADPSFSEVCVETTWHAREGLQGLRRPDVSARRGDLRMAFEVQLSTTFLDVVLGRKHFYRTEGAALVWILPGFHPTYRRMTTDDILFGNNSNILVVDDATLAASKSANQFIVRVWHRQPRIEGQGITDDWIERVVPWNKLLIDVDRQTVCAFDFAGAERAAKAEISRQRDQQRRAKEAAWRAAAEAAERRLRAEIFEWALAEDRVDDLVEYHHRWTKLNYDLVAYCAQLVDDPLDMRVPIRMVKLIETAKAGKPVGFGYESLLVVAHHLFHQHPKLLLGFGHLLRAFGHHHLLTEQDSTRKWADKVAANREAMRCDARFKLPEDQQRLFDFLSEHRCRKPQAGPPEQSEEDKKVPHILVRHA
jgi:hypothetical protein